MPVDDDLAPVVQRNIDTLVTRRRAAEKERGAHHRVADRISSAAGSLRFVAAQLLLVIIWVAANHGPLHVDRDFVGLATVTSVESIFLTVFVLISQKQMRALADERAELDVQMTLLAEHEITRLIRLVDAVAERVGVPSEQRREIEQLTEEVEPKRVLEEISGEHD